MRRLLGLGLLASGVAGAAVIGVRLAGAVGELTSVAASVAVAHVEAHGRETESPALELRPPAAVAPLVPARDGVGDDTAVPLEERELALEYFGDGVSLNDLGQLQSPDPEFDRAIRALANERGEIEARD